MRKIYTPVLVILVIFGVSSTPSFSEIINIPEDYPTIQEGVDASTDGDTILVAPGEYEENIDIQGKQITVTSSNGPYETIILGHIEIFGFADTATCVIQGFTQYGQEWDPRQGRRGIKILSGNPQIIGNIVKHNVWQGNGGGIWVRTSQAIISHNIIEYNWGVSTGGGIDIGDYGYDCENVEVSYNIIRNNRSGPIFQEAGYGGGISGNGGKIFYNIIYDNEVECYTYTDLCGKGGGIALFANPGSPCRIFNNTLVNNTVLRNGEAGDGAGAYLKWRNDPDTLIFENNIIAFNGTGGLYVDSPILGTFVEGYNLLYGNEEYDIFAPETSFTDIFANPLFADTSTDDYALLPGSPCIDAGNPDYPFDPDSTRVDIGALFFDQITDIENDNGPTGPYSFELLQNYPNPFNTQTIISYNLSEESMVSLMVFSITGQLVSSIINKEIQPAGEHKYIWDGTDVNGQIVSTGIYFYELYVDDYRESKAMILIK